MPSRMSVSGNAGLHRLYAPEYQSLPAMGVQNNDKSTITASSCDAPTELGGAHEHSMAFLFATRRVFGNTTLALSLALLTLMEK